MLAANRLHAYCIFVACHRTTRPVMPTFLIFLTTTCHAVLPPLLPFICSHHQAACTILTIFANLLTAATPISAFILLTWVESYTICTVSHFLRSQTCIVCISSVLIILVGPPGMSGRQLTCSVKGGQETRPLPGTAKLAHLRLHFYILHKRSRSSQCRGNPENRNSVRYQATSLNSAKCQAETMPDMKP